MHFPDDSLNKRDNTIIPKKIKVRNYSFNHINDEIKRF